MKIDYRLLLVATRTTGAVVVTSKDVSHKQFELLTLGTVDSDRRLPEERAEGAESEGGSEGGAPRSLAEGWSQGCSLLRGRDLVFAYPVRKAGQRRDLSRR